MGQVPCRRTLRSKLLARKLWFRNSFVDEQVIRNLSWESLWKIWGLSWEIFGRLLVLGRCLGGSGWIFGLIFGSSCLDLGGKMDWVVVQNRRTNNRNNWFWYRVWIDCWSFLKDWTLMSYVVSYIIFKFAGLELWSTIMWKITKSLQHRFRSLQKRCRTTKANSKTYFGKLFAHKSARGFCVRGEGALTFRGANFRSQDKESKGRGT